MPSFFSAVGVAAVLAVAAGQGALAFRDQPCSTNQDCMRNSEVQVLVPGSCDTLDWVCNASNWCEETQVVVTAPENTPCVINNATQLAFVRCNSTGQCPTQEFCDQDPGQCGVFAPGLDCGFDEWTPLRIYYGQDPSEYAPGQDWPGVQCINNRYECPDNYCRDQNVTCGRASSACGAFGNSNDCECPGDFGFPGSGGTRCSFSIGANTPGVCVDVSSNCRRGFGFEDCWPGGVRPAGTCLEVRCELSYVNVSCPDPATAQQQGSPGCERIPADRCAPGPPQRQEFLCQNENPESYCDGNNTCQNCPTFSSSLNCSSFPGQCGQVVGGPVEINATGNPLATCPGFGSGESLFCDCTSIPGSFCVGSFPGAPSGTCQVPCTPKTCDELSADAGAAQDCGFFPDDGCGNSVNCGCPNEQFCSDPQSIMYCEMDCYNRSNTPNNDTTTLCPAQVDAFCNGGNNQSSCESVFLCDPSILPANETAQSACDTPQERAAWAAQCPTGNSTGGGGAGGCLVGNVTVPYANETDCCLQQCREFAPNTCNGPAQDECQTVADCASRWGGSPTPECETRVCATTPLSNGLKRCLELFTPSEPCMTPGGFPNGTTGMVPGVCRQQAEFLGGARICEPLCIPGTCEDVRVRYNSPSICGTYSTFCTNTEVACGCDNPGEQCGQSGICEAPMPGTPPQCNVDSDCLLNLGDDPMSAFGVPGARLPCRDYVCDTSGSLNLCVPAASTYPVDTPCALGGGGEQSGLCDATGSCLGCATPAEIANTLATWTPAQWTAAGLGSFTVLDVSVVVGPVAGPGFPPSYFRVAIRMAGNLSTFNQTLFNQEFNAAARNIDGSCTAFGGDWFSPPVFTSGSVIATTDVSDPGPGALNRPPTPPPSPSGSSGSGSGSGSGSSGSGGPDSEVSPASTTSATAMAALLAAILAVLLL